MKSENYFSIQCFPISVKVLIFGRFVFLVRAPYKDEYGALVE